MTPKELRRLVGQVVIARVAGMSAPGKLMAVENKTACVQLPEQREPVWLRARAIEPATKKTFTAMMESKGKIAAANARPKPARVELDNGTVLVPMRREGKQIVGEWRAEPTEKENQ